MSRNGRAIAVETSSDLHGEARRLFGGLAVANQFLTDAGFIEAHAKENHVYDLEGKQYLDCHTSAGAFNLGRANQELHEQLSRAAGVLDQGNFVMVSSEKSRLARELAAFMPGPLECSLFTVVRGEAFDAACKLARGFTGRSGLVSIDGGWYGQTGFANSLSHGCGQHNYAPRLPATRVIPLGDLAQAKARITVKTAAVVFEPVQAENHCKIVGKEYAQYLRKLCEATGALLIVDETQTGFGRTGRKFAFERLEIQPDIVILGEALSGGMFPMTAMAFTRRVKQFFDEHPLIHLCTFGGHDVGCRVAVKALSLYQAGRIWENASERGRQLKIGLELLASTHTLAIKSISGIGLLWSLQTSGPDKANELCRNALQHGLVVMPGRVDDASVLIRPALTIGKEETGSLLDALDRALSDMAS